VSVIGLSARTMSDDRDKAIEAGCDDYDIKPIEFDRLIGKIERLRPSGRAHGLSSIRKRKNDFCSARMGGIWPK
jgi:DNA-binding response OmpR family regulator